MQQRRYRPGDVLDDYCPRERRITDHAIVAMIDDNIKQTRCVVCDAEHEYKDGKVPPRRRKPQAALFTQVLDGLQGPQPVARVATHLDVDDTEDVMSDDPAIEADPLVARGTGTAAGENGNGEPVFDPLPPTLEIAADDAYPSDAAPREDGPWRRQLIRAALPRSEGQPPPQVRPATDFTIRQPSNNRGFRHGSRRRPGGGQQGGGFQGPMRFGRDSRGPGAGTGNGNGSGNGQGGRRRRGKKR